MASEPSDRTKILNSIRLPRAGTVFLEQEARDAHESNLIDLWSSFPSDFLSSRAESTHSPCCVPSGQLWLFPLKSWAKGITCPKCLQFSLSFSKLSRWGYDAVGRALAGHFALANWLLGIRLNAQWRKFSPQPLSHSATLSDWVAEWLVQPLWQGGWVAASVTLAEWLSGWVTDAQSGWVAEWLSGRVAEWLSGQDERHFLPLVMD